MYFRDPGYEYPPEPEMCLTKYKRNGNDDNGDDDDDDDGDDDDDDNFNESRNNSKKTKSHRRSNEMGAKFHTKTGRDL